MQAVFLSARCPPNAHYERCTCPASCERPKPNCGPPCKPGCVCNSGFLFRGSLCINASSCNCFYNNNYYKVRPLGCPEPPREIVSGTPGFWLHLLPRRDDCPHGIVPRGQLTSRGYAILESFIPNMAFDGHLCFYNKYVLSTHFGSARLDCAEHSIILWPHA